MLLVRRLAAVGTFSIAMGCGGFEPKVHVYVDNGGAEALEVSVDGAPGVAVPAHGRSVVKLKPGMRRFVVRRQGQVVYDQPRDFPEKDQVTKYVLNPDMTRRYTSENVAYKSYATSGSPALDPGTALRSTQLLKPDPWVQGGFDDVFDEVPPDTVTLQRGTVQASRMRLCRVAPEDHDRLVAAQAEYLAAMRARPAEMPHLGDETIAALQRVMNACSSTQ